jgi:hypothetical protein
MNAAHISSADLDAIREDLSQEIWNATLPFQQELMTCGGVTFMGLRNAVTDAILAGPLATALAEAEARGRRQGLEEADEVREAAKHVHDTFVMDMAKGFHTKDKAFAVSILGQALATAPAETQKPETGESVR